MELSLDDILKLAPDDASAKAAKGLVIPAKWPLLQFNDAALWGECQGSGSKPYQVQIDKSGPAFRCSCPSRKFPCKHGLALMLLWQQDSTKFSSGEPPAWVNDWLGSRATRAEKQETKKAETAATEADPAAAAKREAARRERMTAGLADLQRWLADLVHQGLATLPGQPDIWDNMAKRMVDAQLPGIAQRLKEMARIPGRDESWPARLLLALGRLQLLIEAYAQRDQLPEALQTDLLTTLGISPGKDQVIATGEQVKDTWLVIGQAFDEEERLWVRRVWLESSAGKRALLIDFSHGTRQFEQGYLTGSSYLITLVFYPGSVPMRALVIDTPIKQDTDALPTTSSLDNSLGELADSLAINPWLRPLPLKISAGIPLPRGNQWILSTDQQQTIPLALDRDNAWRLIAEATGRPVTLFGEWDGELLRPLSAWTLHTGTNTGNGELIWQEGNN